MGESVTAEESDAAITKAIERRRRTIEAEWNELGAVVLIGAGHPIPIPGRADRVYPFLAHSEYFYLTDHQRPGAVLAYDPQEGWSEFVPAISPDERLWSGALNDEAGTPASELGPWLERRRGRRLAQLGAPIPNAPSDAAVAAELRTRDAYHGSRWAEAHRAADARGRQLQGLLDVHSSLLARADHGR